MQILSNTPQGSDAWHAARAGRFCASEAAAAMGVSKYTARDALLHQKATGITEEVGAAKQRIFDAGHAAEAAARPIADALAGVEFFPAVGIADIEGLPLLASFDGIDVLDEVLWETKSLNQSLATQVQTGDLDPHYWAQLEHQLLVSGGARVLFTTSDGTQEGTHHMWYESKPERRKQVLAAWHQFAKDLAVYTPTAVHTAPVVGRAPDHLPALRIEVSGAVTASNLAEFKATAMAAIAGVNRELSTDSDFADAEASVKWCSEIESRLAAAKQHALSQTVDVDALFRTMDDIAAEARRVRLELDKLVKQRKEQLRGEIVAGGMTALRKHVDSLNQSLGRNYVPMVHADFGGAIKGKRSLESMQGAVNDELARAKIEAGEVAARIQVNLRTLHDAPGVTLSLFPDVATIVLKACDDFAALVQARMAQHQAAEQRRLDAERERIRAEEAAKLRREEEARAHADAVERQRQAEHEAAQARRAQEEEEASARAAAAIAQAAAPAPAPAMPAPAQADNVVDAEIKPGMLLQPPTAIKELIPLLIDDDGARINLGAINEHLAPIKLDAAGLEALGFTPVATVKASKLYRASDLARIRVALIAHLENLHDLETA